MFLNVGSSIYDDKGIEYTLIQIIGQGGFGYVFKAIRKSDNKVFAVKTALPSFGNQDDLISFQNEMQSALKVQGENVIQYEYVHNGMKYNDLPPYIIMEYADGGTLESIIRKEYEEYFDNDTLTNYFLQLANGMNSVNAILVHRDIKPANILICNGSFKITDFGLAKVVSESTRTMTFKGYGTPLYMAPEAWDYSKNTIQMDIYSMGIIFYQLATNTYPYEVQGVNIEDYKNAHLYSIVTTPERINPSLNPSLASIINKMLEKSAKKRFDNWNEIIELLAKQNQQGSKQNSIVLKAISARNLEITKQNERASKLKQQQQEEENFRKRVLVQFNTTIVAALERFKEAFNDQYAGEPIHGYFDNRYSNSNCFSYELIIDHNKKVTISMIYVTEENAIERTAHWGNYTSVTKHKLQYKGKDIWAFGKVINHNDLGFNIILVDDGELYGEWYIINNKNNLSQLTGDEKQEPFYLTIDHIDEVLRNVTGLYSSTINKYNDEQFLSQIEYLAFET